MSAATAFAEELLAVPSAELEIVRAESFVEKSAGAAEQAASDRVAFERNPRFHRGRRLDPGNAAQRRNQETAEVASVDGGSEIRSAKARLVEQRRQQRADDRGERGRRRAYRQEIRRLGKRRHHYVRPFDGRAICRSARRSPDQCELCVVERVVVDDAAVEALEVEGTTLT
ncbi:hypothetical protein [Bradyrhizobium sp. CCGUVB23]|uniref:hypothetical protein n=1 Tax=Bradyrhizobium sp. CCGUVB23 TaxID=2949630 RepID=UPI0020B32569|nr:hypothetical protein [Bradyrhizobium sp. CCGUVB23]MCP3460277.1 hypothetical protein [Bradyrhizobium sp. CCGUVB23]